MSTASNGLRAELGPMIRLGWPLVTAELGWMAMGVVDTIMAGHAGRDLLGAVALGHGLYYTFAVFGVGVLMGLDTLIPQAFGRGDTADCRRSLAGGLVASVLLAPVLSWVVWHLGWALEVVGIEPGLRLATVGYLRALSWGTLPLMGYAALRRYLQSQNIVRPLMFALVSANLVNALGNWVMLYGNWGVTSMGAAGSGYATAIARLYMMLVLLAVVVYRDGWSGWSDWPGWKRVREVMALGLPVALQISLEVAVFALVSTLLGKLGPLPLAGHQIALNIVSVTYMVPLGLSSAAAVRVGQAVGRKDLEGARVAGWTGIGLGGCFMFLMALVLWVAPVFVARIYTEDAEVLALAAQLLVIAAFFQLFDGVQAVATGALRGLGDTRTAMWTHVTCYWGIGLPVGWWLTFSRGWGARGLWVGLSLALILIGLVLVSAWRSRIKTHAFGAFDGSVLPG